MAAFKLRSGSSQLRGGDGLRAAAAQDTATILSRWSTALAGRATTAAVWYGIGESIQEGQGASTVAQRWFDKALASVRAAYPTSGVAGGVNYIAARRMVYAPDSASWINGYTSSSGTLTQVTTGFASTGHKILQMAAASSMTFSVSGTAVDIDWVRGPGGGSFTWAVDGGSTTTVSSNGTYQATTLTRVTFGSRGSHTVTITCSSAPVYISGLFVYDQDESTGVRGVDGGWTGATVATPFLQDLGSGGWPTTLATISPDLVTIELAGNDIIAGTSLATFEANARTLIGILKGLTKVPSIVWLTSYQVASGVTSNSAAPYDAKIKALAAELGFGVISWYDQINQVGTGSSVGLFQSDGIHPNDNGHTVLASSILAYINPEALPYRRPTILTQAAQVRAHYW